MLEKKILHRQVVNVRKKNYTTRGLGKTILNQTKSAIITPTLSLHQSQMLGPRPNFLASMGYQFLLIGMGIRYKNLLAITSLQGKVSTIV